MTLSENQQEATKVFSFLKKWRNLCHIEVRSFYLRQCLSFIAAPIILKFHQYPEGDRIFDCLEYAIISDPEPELTWLKNGHPLVLSKGNYIF